MRPKMRLKNLLIEVVFAGLREKISPRKISAIMQLISMDIKKANHVRWLIKISILKLNILSSTEVCHFESARLFFLQELWLISCSR